MIFTNKLGVRSLFIVLLFASIFYIKDVNASSDEYIMADYDMKPSNSGYAPMDSFIKDNKEKIDTIYTRLIHANKDRSYVVERLYNDLVVTFTKDNYNDLQFGSLMGRIDVSTSYYVPIVDFDGSDYKKILSVSYSFNMKNSLEKIISDIESSNNNLNSSSIRYVPNEFLGFSVGTTNPSNPFNITSSDGKTFYYMLYDTNINLSYNKNLPNKLIFQDGMYNVPLKINGKTLIEGDSYPTYEKSLLKGYDGKIRIPVADFYDGTWSGEQLIFMASNDSMTSKIRIELIPKNGINDNAPLPILVYLNHISDIRDYLKKIAESPSSDPDGYGGGFSIGGGSFGGGGGGGHFGDDTDTCSSFPFDYKIKHKSKTTYSVLSILTGKCKALDGKTPNDFTTEYVDIYYTGKIFKNVDDALDDYNSNLPFLGLLGPDSTFGQLVNGFLDLIDNKLPIIGQISDFITSLSNTDYEENKTPPEIKVNFLGVESNIIDFSLYSKYRDTVFFWIKIFLGFSTLLTALYVIRGYFGGE